jgi:hypothetical protein
VVYFYGQINLALKKTLKTHIFCIFLLCMFHTTSHAQVNIEQYRAANGISGNIGLSLGGASGNSDFFTGGGAANVTIAKPTYSVLLLGDGLLGFRGGETFSNQGLAHVRYTWTKPPRFQPEAFTQADYARPRELTFRYLIGGGIRTLLFEDKTYTLTLGNGLMFEHERLNLIAGDTHPAHTSVIRANNYANIQIRKKATITITAYYQFIPNNAKDFRFLLNTQIASRVAGPLQQVSTIRYRRDSRPPLSVKKNDFTIGTSFALSFGDKKKKTEDKSEK